MRLEPEDDRQLARQLRRAGRGSGPEEGLGDRAETQEGDEAHLARAHEAMAGDLGAALGDDELGAFHPELDAGTDEGARHAVAGRAEADGAQVVDGADLRGADGRACRGRGRRRVRSTASRSSGTAAVSVWTRALTSRHHVATATFASARSTKGPSPTSRSVLA